MAKRFNFRFSGVLPAFCRPSKHTTSKPYLSCFRLPPASGNTSDSNWSKSNNWHVLDTDSNLPRRKIYTSAASASEDEKPHIVSLPPPRAIRRRKNNKKPYGSVRLSVSSSDSGLFSEDEHRFIETLVSNSTDSSADFSPHLQSIREASSPGIRSKRRKHKRRMKKLKIKEEDDYAAARLSAVFRRLVPCTAARVEGKVRESLAVVKRSEEPYEDFKRSMVEMIVEKEMVEEKDLQELLRCFLSLNSEQHHGIIVRAFDDIVMSSSSSALFFSESRIG